MTDTPINILMTEINAFGGAERSIVALSRWLHEKSLRHRLVVYADRIGLAGHADHPMEIVALNPEAGPIRKVAALKRHFRNVAADAPKPLVSGIQAALHLSLIGLRGFHTLMFDTPSLLGEGADPDFKSRLRWAVSNRVLAHGLNTGGVTIVNSAYLAAESRTLWHPPIKIIPMGGMVRTAFRPRRPDGALRILSVSRVESNKRIDWMLRGLAMLERRSEPLSRRVDWRLDVVGGGSQVEAMRALAGELGLSGRVTLHGFVNDRALEDFYDAADMFLMPARQGYGIPAVEALARGIPVMLHRESEVSDLLLKTPWALIMEGGEDSMPAAIDRAITGFLDGRHLGVPLPAIPTENMWAEQVARACGWWIG